MPEWARYIGQFVRLAAMLCACRLAGWYLSQKSILLAAATFGLLIVLLQETIRAIVVDNVVTDGWIDLRWVGLLMSRLPGTLLSFYSGAAAVVIGRKISADRPVVALVAVATASAIGYFALQPLLRSLADTVTLALHLGEAPEAHKPPYGFYEYKFIYGMFLEPTIASFALIYLVWPALNGSKARRIALFTGLLLLIRGRVVATFLFSFWIKDSLPMALAAEGQFFVETALLAALTGLTWTAVTPSVIKVDQVDV
ncbi:hypothetical protein NF699_02665 [Sphingomonadaceae bacterium OTU29LAMAA1]|nr:hypothetical protein NF699_02665 [Sphingomonadaceae bacterium OTU29LAMAA1]